MMHFQDKSVTLHHGDCLDVLREMPDCSVDAVVTDPPYGLANTDPAHVTETLLRWVNGEREYLPGGAGFMGKAWDAFVPPVAVWDDCLRVLKPGGHVLAFAGSRTVDLMTLGLRLAGFDIRDSIAWLYGSGFPKSLDVSKAIDKAANAAPLWDEIRSHVREWRDRAGMTNHQLNAALGLRTTGSGMAAHWTRTGPNQQAIPTKEMWLRLKALLGWPDCDLDATYDAVKDGADRPVIGVKPNALSGWSMDGGSRFADRDITAPATPDAERWQGWGTALKPAFEPVVVARKPLAGTVAANVLAHGTGALNIDACRVGTSGGRTVHTRSAGKDRDRWEGNEWTGEVTPNGGRWPSNVVLDESQADALDEQSGTLTSGANPTRRGSDKVREAYGDFKGQAECDPARGADSGGASRFFYVAKADASERPRVNGTAHPTVKPLDLMRWLVRLVTPPGGKVLEPFAGSGTTVEACIVEGFDCIAIEREADYLPLIEARISRRRDPVRAIELAGEDMGLFDLDGGAA